MEGKDRNTEILTALVDMIADRVAAKLRDQLPSPAPATDGDPLLGVREAARFLNLSTSTIYKKPDLPRIKVGGKLCFRRSELEAWLVAQQAPTGVELAPWPGEGE